MRRTASTYLFCALLLASAPAAAAPTVEVPAGKVSLGQVWSEAPDDVAGLEIGPAPPAGSSRLLLRRELQRRLRAAGKDPTSLRLPASVRIKTLSVQWSADRLRQAATDAARSALPSGVSLRKVNVNIRLVLPEGTVVSELKVPRPPRRVGDATLSAMLLLEYDGEIVRRVPVSLSVDVSEEAAQPPVLKGARLRVYIERSTAQITAVAEALQDADIGETVQFRIVATRRVVRARVESKHLAKVVMR